MRSPFQRARRLAYLVAQHPFRLHRALLRRGLLCGWLDELARYPGLAKPGLPIDNPAGFQALRYAHAMAYAAGGPYETEDARYRADSAECMLYSFLWRREMHPARWLPWAWALRECRSILEYGSGAAPFADGMTRGWPFHMPEITVADLEWPLLDYCRWRFQDEDHVQVIRLPDALRPHYEGIVITETFEHLTAPLETAERFTEMANVIVFDYVDGGGEPAGRAERSSVLAHFAKSGRLNGPDARGWYVWRR